jgi:hypothetical protein
VRCPRAVSQTGADGSETRPAGHVAGLPGAGCPGSGSVVRDHEARDRTEPKPRGFGESRSGAPRGERALAQGARRARLARPARVWCGDPPSHRCGVRRVRAYRRSASLHFRGAKHSCRAAKLGREQKARRENEIAFSSAPAIAGEGDHLAKQDGGGGVEVDASLSSNRDSSRPTPPPPRRCAARSPSPVCTGEDAKRAARETPDACFRLTIDLQ